MTRRTVVYFLLVFAAFGVPVAIAAFLAAIGPAPYVIVEDPPAELAGQTRFEDGSMLVLNVHDTPEQATEAMRRDFGAMPTSFVNRTFDVARYTRSDNGMHGLIMPVERYVIQVEAPDADAVEARFHALGFVTENPERNIVWVALAERLPLTLTALFAYVVLVGLFMARGGAWAARVTPDPAVAPVPAARIRDTLLAINALNQPFNVYEERPGRLVAEWRVADANWITVLSAGGLRRAHRIHIDLDETSRTARVVEKSYKISWGGGVRRFSGRLAFFQGISFAGFERGRMVGLIHEPGKGWAVREGYNYRFDVSEMRAPLVEAILGGGWVWQPVMTFFRPIGG